jgi:uncharacterized membrane protein
MFKFGKNKAMERSDLWIFGTLLVFGIVGLVVSFILAVEEFHLLKNPNAILTCSINVVLNCATVMKTWQASVFGFPNMFIGLMGFPIVITIAVALLGGVKFPRWFLIGANIGLGLGVLFAYWLFLQSVYTIEVLCPWCLVITFTMTMLISTITHYNLRENSFGFKKETNKKVQNFIKNGYGKLLTAAWVVLLVALVILKFGDSLFG